MSTVLRLVGHGRFLLAHNPQLGLDLGPGGSHGRRKFLLDVAAATSLMRPQTRTAVGSRKGGGKGASQAKVKVLHAPCLRYMAKPLQYDHCPDRLVMLVTHEEHAEENRLALLLFLTPMAFPVETDPKKLVTHCCGLNYKLEGDEVPLKPDSEYPDWLFKMDIKRPLPTSDEMEPGTLEYFLQLRKEHEMRQRRIKKLMRKLKIVI